MSSSDEHQVRRCRRCGASLAGDNSEAVCGPCRSSGRGEVPAVPDVPPEFWDDAEIRRALAARHMGEVIRAYRRHPWHGRGGLRQQEVAGWAGMNQPQLSRIENGPPMPHLDRLIFWAQLLRIPQQYLWFDPPGDDPGGRPDRSGGYEAEPGDRGGGDGDPAVPSLLEWPVQVGRPPARSRAFQPREGLAAEIADALAGRDGGLRQVVVTGGGGVGKTQLAAAAFAGAREEGTDLLLWVSASSREAIMASYAHARGVVEQGTVAPDLSADDAAEAFLGWLGVTARSWMVVLDDVADPADVRGLWPEGRSGRVLATTRRRDLAPAGARQVSVGAFTSEEARGYLVERLGGSPAQPAHPDALDEAAELAEDLGRLPVALAQAAAVILNEGITCAAYRERFAGRSASFDRLFPADAGADDYAHTVATTWSLAIDRADRLPPEGLARPALYVAAVVDPNGAPDVLWSTGAVLGYLDRERRRGAEDAAPRAPGSGGPGGPGPSGPEVPGAVEPDAGDAGRGGTTADEARAALRNLHRLSLLIHEPGGGASAVRTHALVQRAALEPLSRTRLDEIVRVAADGLVEIWPTAETDSGHSRVLRQSAATLAGRSPGALWRPEGHEVVLRAGQSLGELGLVQDAVTYWRDTAATAARILGPDHPQALTSRHNLADWRGVAGDPAGAADALEELHRDCRRALGADHPDTLTTRNDLADWRGVAGDGAGAAAAAADLLDDSLRVLGPDHPNTLAARHSLAFWQGVAGDAVEAVQAFEELLADRTRVLGPDHPDTHITRHNLARWTGAAGDTAGAVRQLEELLVDRTRVLGADHPDTIDTRLGLGWWRGAAADAAGAAREFAAVYEDALRVLGPDHLHTLNARHGMARWTAAAGDVDRAIRVLEDLLDDRLPLLGPEHPQIVGIRVHLAWCLGAAGDAAGAASAFKDLIDVHLRVYGPDHPYTMATRHDLASWVGAAGDAAGAAAVFEELLEDQLRVHGPDHPDTLATRRRLARWQGAAGDAAGAARAFDELLGDALRALGADHLHTLTVRHSLAYWRGAAGDAAGAAGALGELLVELHRLLGADHPHTRATARHLDRWGRLAGREAGARPGVGDHGSGGRGAGEDDEWARALGDLRRDRLPLREADNPQTLSARMGLADWRIGQVRRTTSW